MRLRCPLPWAAPRSRHGSRAESIRTTRRATPTTPVLESGYATPERFYRRNADIEAFNAAARETLEPLGEEIDDLYRVMAPAPAAEHSDATHWNTEAGARRIGEAVLSCVRAALS